MLVESYLSGDNLTVAQSDLGLLYMETKHANHFAGLSVKILAVVLLFTPLMAKSYHVMGCISTAFIVKA